MTAPTASAGGVHVDVLPDFTGFPARFAAGLKALTANDHVEIVIDVDERPLKRADREAQKLDRDTKSLSDKFRAFNLVTGLSAPRLIAFASSAGLAVQVVSNLGAALAPASGLLIALPAIVGAGAIALGTLKLGLSGVGDTLKAGWSGDLKKYNEGLKDLAPNARDATRALIGMKSPINDIKKAVQDRLFGGVGDDLRAIGRTYLPDLEKRLPRVAGSLSVFFENFAGAAANKARPLFKGVNDLIDATSVGLARANDNVGPLTDSIGILFSVGAGLARDMLGAVGSLAGQFANFIEQANRTGDLQRWLQAALDTLSTLGGLLANVGSILFSVLSAANSAGGSFLITLEGLTGQIADFLNSAAGASALQAIFSAVSQVGQALGRVIGAVLPAIGAAIVAISPTIGPLVDALADVLITMVPLIPAFAQLAILILTNVTPAIIALTPLVAGIVSHLTNFVARVIEAKDFLIPLVAGIVAMIGVIKVITTITKIWNGLILVTNILLTANPIGIVVVLLVGLAVALFTAYKRSETFRNIVDSTFRAIAAAGKFMWEKVLRPMFETLGRYMTKTVPGWFRAGASAIGDAWDAIKSLAAKPVNFVIGTVLNNGLFKAWNWVADKFGADSLRISPLPLIGTGGGGGGPRATRGRAFANGGLFDGLLPGPPSKKDNLIARAEGGPVALATGEFIVNSESTSKWLPVLDFINSKGRGFADGGLFGSLGKSIGGFFSKGASIAGDALKFLSDPVKWLKDRLAGPLNALNGLGSGPFGSALGAGAHKLFDVIFSKAKSLLGSIFGSGGGRIAAGLGPALAFAQSMVGAPYTWAAAGPKSVGFDCSGFMGAIANFILGQSPFHRRGSTASFPWPGFAPGMGAFSIGSTPDAGGGIGHMAGTLNGVNVESRGGVGVIVGPRARGARDPLFHGNIFHLLGFANGGLLGDLPFDVLDPRGKDYLDPRALFGNVFDQGGWLPPGLSLNYNGTGRPERVLDPEASDDYRRGRDDFDYDRLASAVATAMRDHPEKIGRELARVGTKGARS